MHESCIGRALTLHSSDDARRGKRPEVVVGQPEQPASTVPPEVLYAYRLDFTNLPAYNPAVVEMERTDDCFSDVGAAYRFRLRVGRLRIPVTLRVTAAEP